MSRLGLQNSFQLTKELWVNTGRWFREVAFLPHRKGQFNHCTDLVGAIMLTTLPIIHHTLVCLFYQLGLVGFSNQNVFLVDLEEWGFLRASATKILDLLELQVDHGIRCNCNLRKFG